jgi:tRNA (Thr-GGU) A37 N-methylase
VSVDAEAGVLVLGGVDIVDGSPVLDIKPYVPFSDALPDATAPGWVTVSKYCGKTPPAHMHITRALSAHRHV